LAEKAFGDDGSLKQPKQLSINKVGHGTLFENCICCSYFLMLHNDASGSGVSL